MTPSPGVMRLCNVTYLRRYNKSLILIKRWSKESCSRTYTYKTIFIQPLCLVIYPKAFYYPQRHIPPLPERNISGKQNVTNIRNPLGIFFINRLQYKLQARPIRFSDSTVLRVYAIRSDVDTTRYRSRGAILENTKLYIGQPSTNSNAAISNQLSSWRHNWREH